MCGPLRFYAGLLCLLLLTGRPAAAGETAVGFGLISAISSEQTLRQWQPMLDALAVHLGGPVTSMTAPDYAGVVTAMQSGRVQLAWLGNKSAIDAVDRAGAEVFAEQVYPGGRAGYYSFLIVNAASPFKSADEVLAHAGELTLATGDRGSTSGYAVPRLLLFSTKGEPEKIFKRTVSGNHETNFLAVARGKADVAAVASNHLDDFAKTHPEESKAVRVVWRSPEIPGDPLVWRKDLPAETKAQVREFFLGYCHDHTGKSDAQAAAECAVLDNLGIGRFIASNDRQLVLIRRLDLLGRRMAIEGDASLSADHRRKRLAEIDRRLDELGQATAGR